MSEAPQIVEPITIVDEDKQVVVAVATTTTTTTAPAAAAAPPAGGTDDEDLEDGEIDDDDDDDALPVAGQTVTTVETSNSLHERKTSYMPQSTHHNSNNKNNTNSSGNNRQSPVHGIVTIDLVNDGGPTPPPTLKSKKKGQPLEDDHASNIENAIASALKKKGIEPLVPKILESRNGQQHDSLDNAPGQGQSRSSRRRKRKRQRDDKDKDNKERKPKKHRYESDEPGSATGAPPLLDSEMDMDDYEMMNVRGGSPPPVTQQAPASYKDQYDSADDSCSSYDSYDSLGEGGGVGGAEGGRRRQRRRGKKSRKRRGERGDDARGGNRDDDRNGRQDKRSRRDSGDDKHRQEPRKLELCKFYLMECCAKREKCSYMHADFPCKYYYLGMDCVQKEECKFGHGEPMTEQLRNILLKHLETAPKEILGNFKRISRETAITQMTKRHEELCKQFGVENNWSSIQNIPMNHHNRRGDQMQHQQQQQQQQQQQMLQQLIQQQQLQQLQQQQQLQSQLNPGGIPSLLDMVINPPPIGAGVGAVLPVGLPPVHNAPSAQPKGDKQRKSRWADGNCGASSVEPPSSSAPAYLDLKNLTGILSAEHIEKLSQLGILNLEQVNQLTFGQLNQIGLTIAEISEIQLNAINMAKLGVTPPVRGVSAASSATDSSSTRTSDAVVAIPANRDVDMRFLPSTTSATTTTATATATTTAKEDFAAHQALEKDFGVCSNSNSNSSGVVTVDYSQYLKDSNLSFDRSDMYDDEKDDDDELVIDDGNLDAEENAVVPKIAKVAKVVTPAVSEEKKTLSTFASDLAHRLRLPDISIALKNPFSALYTSSSEADKKESPPHRSDPRDPRDPRRKPSTWSSGGARNEDDEDKSQRNPFKAYKDEAADSDDDNERYYSSRRANKQRSACSRSRTPSQSSTPEASQSPEPQDDENDDAHRATPNYERKTMYDFSARQAAEDEASSLTKTSKADKDMRYTDMRTGSGDIDLRLPFQPVPNYTPATEIDCSITSHLPMTYKVYEVTIARPNYAELRQNFKSVQTSDPRLRRILGLPELSQSKTSAALSRTVRKLSNNIASPTESDGASPKYYSPSTKQADERRPSKSSSTAAPSATTTTTTAVQPRMDPRRAAAAASAAAAAAQASATAVPTTGSASAAMKQNVEIRNLLQKSEWYKDLNSKFKIMVNQQLALVSTELKKFHQDSSPQKIFDISFIVNNATLQRILTNLGIYIDDNGEVTHVDGDNDNDQNSGGSNGGGLALPNLSQPPPTQQQLGFLSAPPPNMAQQQFRAGCPPQAAMNLPPFGPPPNTRPSLLGMPPGGHFNPFAGGAPGNMNDMGGMNPNFGGGGGLGPMGGGPGPMGGGPGPMGGGPGPMGGGPFGFAPNMQQQQQRNFGGGGNQRNHLHHQQQLHHRNQQNRRNNNYGNKI